MQPDHTHQKWNNVLYMTHWSCMNVVFTIWHGSNAWTLTLMLRAAASTVWRHNQNCNRSGPEWFATGGRAFFGNANFLCNLKLLHLVFTNAKREHFHVACMLHQHAPMLCKKAQLCVINLEDGTSMGITIGFVAGVGLGWHEHLPSIFLVKLMRCRIPSFIATTRFSSAMLARAYADNAMHFTHHSFEYGPCSSAQARLD